jgi:tetratricopeptide (TPR) repeat protein
MKIIKSKELLTIDIEGSLDGAIKQLESYKERYSEYTNLRIVADYIYEGGYYYDLYGDKLETDLEESNRLAAEKQRNEIELEYERKQYEALKAKFGKIIMKKYRIVEKRFEVSKPYFIVQQNYWFLWASPTGSGSRHVCTYGHYYKQFETFEEAEEALKKCIEEYQRTRNPDRVVKTYEIK